METIVIRYKQLDKAYGRLDYMVETYKRLLEKYNNLNISLACENELIVHKEALIKRFEFCFELTWKYYKLLLKEIHGKEVASSRVVFRECYNVSLFDLVETELLTTLLDVRNSTVHVYDEEMSDEIALKILELYAKLRQIITKSSQFSK